MHYALNTPPPPLTHLGKICTNNIMDFFIHFLRPPTPQLLFLLNKIFNTWIFVSELQLMFFFLSWPS